MKKQEVLNVLIALILGMMALMILAKLGVVK